MSISIKNKRGRKPVPHVTAWGDPIPGLARRPSDGRWRVVATGYTFTEPNERLAVDRFHELTAKAMKDGPRVNISRPVSNTHSLKAAMIQNAAAIQPVYTVHRATTQSIPADGVYRGGQREIGHSIPMDSAFWAMVTDLLLNHRQLVARQTGIESVAWLEDAKRPAPSLTFKAIGDLYAAKPGLSPNEVSRSKLFWGEFCKAAGIESVRELTHEHVAAYEKVILSGKYAPKSILHRIRKIRTIFAFAIKRGQGIEDCRKALDITAMLEIKDHTPLDPRPISPADFWSIHSAAVAADDQTFAAMLLVALNAAMYPSEAAALKWEEIDLAAGELSTRRRKTAVPRVAMLWPTTIAALKNLPRKGEHVFYTRVRSYTVFSALDAWRKYRTVAKLGDDVTFSQIRDAAFTVACRISLDQARVLAGHRLPGASDHYIRRNPAFVTDACKAIRSVFYAPRKSAGKNSAA